MQTHIVDQSGAKVDLTALDSANSPYQIPKMQAVQQPTGSDKNVLPGSSGFRSNFKAGFVEDPRTKIAQHAKALFPNDPNAVQRFGIRDGQIVYIDDDLNVKSVDSGFRAGAGNALAYAPETIGGIVGSFATGNPVTGSALGAMGGKGVKQIIAGTVLGDPQTMLGNVKGMAGEGAINLLTGGLAKAGGKLLNKGKVVDFTPAQSSTAQNVQREVQQKTGIQLDLAQASQDPQLMSLRKYAAKFPGESSKIFKDLDELQTTQSAEAMQKLVDSVSRAMSSEASGKAGINAAQEAIRAARAGVSQQVKPLYDAAYAAVPEVADPKILEMLKLGPFQKALTSAKEMAALEGVDASKNSLQLMDYVKRGLDDQISVAKAGGQNQLARALTMRRKEFVGALDAIPNQEWQAARKAYGDLAKTNIEPLENGAVGILARIKDQKAATAAAKMFSDPAITAREIMATRAAITKADPEAWNGLAGQYLAGVLDKSLKVSQKGETINLAGKLYQAMAATPETTAKLRAALPSSSNAILDDVLKGLKFVASTDRVGSDTAFNQLVTRKIEGRFSTTLKALRSPVQTAIQAGEERQLDKMVLNLSRGLTDPAQLAQLKQVSKASPGIQRSLQLLSILVAPTAARAGEGVINPLPDMPIQKTEPLRGAGRQPAMRENP